MDIPNCPNCGRKAEMLSGDLMYWGQTKLSHFNYFVCRPCNYSVQVSTDPNLQRPMSSQEVRTARQQAHFAFDPIWHSGLISKGSAYVVLAQMMGIEPKDCHIGNFDVNQCKRVIEIVPEIEAICARSGKKPKAALEGGILGMVKDIKREYGNKTRAQRRKRVFVSTIGKFREAHNTMLYASRNGNGKSDSK